MEFAGPQSDILKHVPLTIVERGNCTTKQICSFGGIGKDTCQSGTWNEFAVVNLGQNLE